MIMIETREKDGIEILSSTRILCEQLLSFSNHVIHDYVINSKPYKNKQNKFMSRLIDLKVQINKFFSQEEIISYVDRKKFTHHFITKMETPTFEKIMRTKIQGVKYSLKTIGAKDSILPEQQHAVQGRVLERKKGW